MCLYRQNLINERILNDFQRVETYLFYKRWSTSRLALIVYASLSSFLLYILDLNSWQSDLSSWFRNQNSRKRTEPQNWNNSNRARDEATWDNRIFETSTEGQKLSLMGDQKSPLGDQEVAVDFRRELYLSLNLYRSMFNKVGNYSLQTLATDNRRFNNSNFISIISILDTFCC